jgi:hypothetical protein
MKLNNGLYPKCPNLGKCPQRFHPAMLSTSDKTRYGAHGVKTGAPDGHAARMPRHAAPGVRCVGFVLGRGGKGTSSAAKTYMLGMCARDSGTQTLRTISV